MEKWLVFLIVFAALGSGMIAGVFFAFSNFVMQALGRLPPADGLRAMQAINVTVINPAFFAAFFGTAIVSLVLLGIAVLQWNERGAAHLLGAGLLYVFGSVGVTLLFNVPLNQALAATDARSADAPHIWLHYQRQWTRWNHVRAFAALISSALFIHPLW
jgi:uncharacterized membrane protein